MQPKDTEPLMENENDNDSSGSSVEDETESSGNLNVELVREKYKIFRNHCYQLYDFLFTHTLEWPSYTIQWLPERRERKRKYHSLQNMILGTCTNGKSPNHLIIAEVRLPLEDWDPHKTNRAYSHNNNKVVIDVISNKFRIVKAIKHDGDINIARYMPQKPSIVATKTDCEEVYIFDCKKRPSRAHGRPELRLFGHQTDGYGLSWSKFKSGHLLSAAYDSTICVWDINATPKNNTLDALRVFKVSNLCFAFVQKKFFDLILS